MRTELVYNQIWPFRTTLFASINNHIWDFSHATQPHDSVHPPLTKELLNAAKEVKTTKCGQHGVTIVSQQRTMLVFKRKINHYLKKKMKLRMCPSWS